MCALALTFVTATAALAQPSTASLDEQRGTVMRLDRDAHVIVFDDGRMYRATPNTVLVIDNRPVAYEALQPGSTVVIRAAEPVAFQNGRYIVVTPAPVPGSTAVVAAPVTVAPAPASAYPAVVRQTVYGTVTDIDRDGEVTVKTQKGEFEMRVTGEALRYIRKGDTVTLDATFSPAGSPAASPATR
jgi:hypothetical protein